MRSNRSSNSREIKHRRLESTSMKLSQVLQSLNAKTMWVHDPRILDREYTCVSATDLMSDALAMVKSDTNHTLLLTGLQNAQSLRTAEMLDIQTIIYVRSKELPPEDLQLAKEMEMNVFSTGYSMYEACGVLYMEGLATATKSYD